MFEFCAQSPVDQLPDHEGCTRHHVIFSALLDLSSEYSLLLAVLLLKNWFVRQEW